MIICIGECKYIERCMCMYLERSMHVSMHVNIPGVRAADAVETVETPLAMSWEEDWYIPIGAGRVSRIDTCTLYNSEYIWVWVYEYVYNIGV